MAADTKRYHCFSVLLIFVVVFIRSSYAYQFYVGGRAGWVVNPPEDYNHWAGRMRFQVNDTLFFKYEKGSNSVFEVNRDDYNQCNTNNPILKLKDGNSIFKFDRSGPFYFISGNKTFCDQGQKIITVVLAIRAPTPPGQSPAPVPAPASPSPAPAGHSPALTPASSPAPASSFPPSISPSPVATPPGGSNASTPGTSPVSAPPVSPSGESPPSPPGSSGSSPPSSTPNGNGNSPANNNSSSARPAFTTSTVLMSAVSLVFVATLGAPIF